MDNLLITLYNPNKYENTYKSAYTDYNNNTPLYHILSDKVFIQMKKCFNTVLLRYFFMCIWGHSLHFKSQNAPTKSPYLFHSNVKILIQITENTSIPTSVEPTKIKHFTTFNQAKNHPIPHPNHPQTQQNQALYRNQPKFNIYIETKHHINTNVNSQYINKNTSKSNILANILTIKSPLTPKSPNS